MTSYNFERPIMIHVCKDGTVSYRTKGQKVFNGVALPVFSVNTVEEAKRIQTRFCRLMIGPHPQAKPNTGTEDWYVLNSFSGELDELDHVSAMFADFYATHIAAKTERSRGRADAAKQRGAIAEKRRRQRSDIE
jgi:hypothetical protein